MLLDEVDKALERRGHRFARYADDCNVYVQSKRAGERVMETLMGLYAKLRLQVNTEKSAVARVWDRQFLGFSFWTAPGRVIKRRVAPKALQARKERVRAITARNGGRSVRQVVTELRGSLVGWKAYSRLADTPGVFADIDKWLVHRLRTLHGKPWKRGTTIFRELRARPVSEPVAASGAGYSQRWWALGHHSALHLALPRTYFDSLGLPRLAGR